jgi:hypothetical protein
MIKIFFILFYFLKTTFTQQNSYNIGDVVDETITENKYYMIDLDQSQISSDNSLVIYIKPTDNYEEFSDPDLYVSSLNYYPHTYYESEWRSTHFGRDILAIPTTELRNSTKLYIGIVCERKCRYEFKVEYQRYIEIIANTMGIVYIGSETSVVLKYAHHNDTSKIFEIYSAGNRHSDYKMETHYIAGDNSDREIKSFTSWAGGYSAIVDTEVYSDCDKCYFHVVLTSLPYSKIIVGMRDANVTQSLVLNKNYFGSLRENIIDCYKFTEKQLDDKSNNFIFFANSFRNFVNLSIRNVDDRTTSLKDYSFEYDLTIKFTYDELVNNTLCLTPDSNFFSTNSYSFIFFREDDIEDIGDFKLFSGVMQKGYLPAYKVITYSLWSDTVDSFKSMKLYLKSLKGNSVMYGYFCSNDPCSFNNSTIRIDANLLKTTPITDEYNLVISPDSNKCNTLPEFCHVQMVILCDSEVECEYHLSMTIEKDHLFLAEK